MTLNKGFSTRVVDDMVDLNVDFAGVRMKNPIILASGGPGWDGEHMRRCAEAGAGALVPKSLGPPGRWLHHPRMGRMGLFKLGKRPYGMINLELFSTLPLERWLEEELRVAAGGGAPIIASIVACPEPSDTQKTALAVAETGYASMVEINVSCPMPAGEVGMHIGRHPDLVAEQVSAVKETVDIPVAVKLSPNYAYIDEVAEAAEDAGADAIMATNSVQSFFGVDIETGIPPFPAFGGYSGPAIRPITMKCVAQIARKVDIPVSAIGGVSTWKDVAEYIMVGATTVQTCTAVMWGGMGVFGELSNGLRSFMERKGYDRIEDFRGIALKHLTTVEELSKREPMRASVDRDACNGCRTCTKVCQYDAIQFRGEKAEVIQESCDGCGLCVAWCPVDAITLV